MEERGRRKGRNRKLSLWQKHRMCRNYEGERFGGEPRVVTGQTDQTTTLCELIWLLFLSFFLSFFFFKIINQLSVSTSTYHKRNMKLNGHPYQTKAGQTKKLAAFLEPVKELTCLDSCPTIQRSEYS